MNKIAVIRQALDAAKPVLQGKVLASRGARDDGMDATVELGWQGRDLVSLAVQVRLVERNSLAWYRMEKEVKQVEGQPWLLIAPYVSPNLALECQRTGINFLDTAGNAHLDLPGTHVFITGKPRHKEPRIPSDQSALRKASTLRVIFALLTIEGLAQQPVRAITEAAGAALGSTSNAIEDLAALGFITGAARKRRLANRQALQTEWARQYPISLRGKLNPQRYAPVLIRIGGRAACSPMNPRWRWAVKWLLPRSRNTSTRQAHASTAGWTAASCCASTACAPTLKGLSRCWMPSGPARNRQRLPLPPCCWSMPT